MQPVTLPIGLEAKLSVYSQLGESTTDMRRAFSEACRVARNYHSDAREQGWKPGMYEHWTALEDACDLKRKQLQHAEDLYDEYGGLMRTDPEYNAWLKQEANAMRAEGHVF